MSLFSVKVRLPSVAPAQERSDPYEVRSLRRKNWTRREVARDIYIYIYISIVYLWERHLGARHLGDRHLRERHTDTHGGEMSGCHLLPWLRSPGRDPLSDILDRYPFAEIRRLCTSWQRMEAPGGPGASGSISESLQIHVVC